MQIAKIKDNAVEKIGEHTDLFPNVSFPASGPTSDWMTEKLCNACNNESVLRQDDTEKH